MRDRDVGQEERKKQREKKRDNQRPKDRREEDEDERQQYKRTNKLPLRLNVYFLKELSVVSRCFVFTYISGSCSDQSNIRSRLV